ncbi:MAG: LuxR C-terminal-related transcriptional regulator [Thermomicrobiales bacterium]
MDRAATALPFWLARTKLHPPVPRDDTFARPRLVARLREAVRDARLTLVTAPAGYGKTTLLASFAAAHPDLALAWLSLDQDENDPARFLTALLAAARRLCPDGGREAADLLASLPNPTTEARRIVAALIGDLLPTLPDPAVLVLDDLHAITDPAAFVALDALLEHLPPQLHLVVATRHDPPLDLARVRARGELAEVRLADLRFAPGETAAFLNDRVGLGLAAAHLALIHERTEGGVGGLGFAADVLTGLPTGTERATLLDALARSDRDAVAFLVGEVLARQEPAGRDFLLATAILAELTPARCATLTGQADAGARLDALARQHRFILPSGGARRSYRYHDRVKEFLRQQLARERAADLPALHRRAAQAEREAGLPDRAIDHSLAAGAWDEAAHLIDQVGEQVLEQRALDTLRAWITALPGAMQGAYPRLAYLLGVIAWDRGHFSQVQPLVDRARAGFRVRGDREGEGSALAALIKVFAEAGAFPRSMALFDRALALPQRPHSRVELLVSRSAWALALGNVARSVRDLEAALAIVETTNDRRALHVLAINFYGNLAILPGGPEAVDRFRQLVATIGDGGQIVRACNAHLTATAILWRGDWLAAIPLAEAALALSNGFDALIRVEIGARMLLAGCAAIAGDAAAADRQCAGLLAAIERPGFAILRDWRGAFLQAVGRVRVLQGRIGEARTIAGRMDAEAAPTDWPSLPGGRAILHGLIARAEGDERAAEARFREAKELLRPYPDALWFGDADLLLAAARVAQGHPNEALALFGSLLAECARAGTPGRILWNGQAAVEPLLRLAVAHGLHADYARSLLGQFAAPAPAPAHRAQGTGTPLTDREIEVLRLVATGAENAAIAAQLFISVNTVRNHVAHALAKLGVGSRTTAVARAREVGVL